MILYNVTINIDESVHDEWLEWMKTKHIPEVLATGLFTGNKIYKIKSTDPEEGNTYSIQYFLNSMEDYEKYQKDFAPELQDKHSEKYKDKFASFRTIMESV
ncbi:MAG TPA: DUF4286 family protein [Ignavibacteria bacterium]|mgnify:CR=1 FL=1|nr:DUF4286 family protein [Ignavibacteria bacterium]